MERLGAWRERGGVALNRGEESSLAHWRSVLQCAGGCTAAQQPATNSSNYESHISLIILTYTRITDTQRHSVLRSSREMAADNCTSQVEF